MSLYRPCWNTGLGPTRWRMSLTTTTAATPGAGQGEEQGAGLVMSISQSPATPPSYSVRWALLYNVHIT